MRALKLSYLNKIEEEVHKFLQDNVKHDFLKPDRELSLDLMVREAEILISANSDIKGLAESGNLRELHEKCRNIQDKVEADFLKVRDHLDRIIAQVEEKENEIYD